MDDDRKVPVEFARMSCSMAKVQVCKYFNVRDALETSTLDRTEFWTDKDSQVASASTTPNSREIDIP